MSIWYNFRLLAEDAYVTLGANAIAYVVSAVGYPDRVTANIFSGIVSPLTLYTMLHKSSYREAGGRFWDPAGCSLNTAMHYGPVNDTTWDGWVTGSWCRTSDAKMLTVWRGMEEYQKTISADSCYTICSNLDDEFRLHVFLTAAPAGQLPSKEFCHGEIQYLGNCPAHDRYIQDSPRPAVNE